MKANSYTIEKRQFVEDSYIVNFTRKNYKGEKLSVWIEKCFDNDSEKSLPKIWFRNGRTKKILPTYWNVNTYCYDRKGYCYGFYNPQVKPETTTINFDWMLEATEENMEILIQEIYKRFYVFNNKY